MPAQLLGQKTPEPPKPDIHPENEEIWAALEELQAGNQQLVQQLAGFGAGIDPATIMHIRITSLIEALFPSGTAEGQANQIRVGLSFESMMANVLAEARRSVVAAQLQAGAQVPPEMLEQMAKASGQYVPDGFRQGAPHRKLCPVA